MNPNLGDPEKNEVDEVQSDALDISAEENTTEVQPVAEKSEETVPPEQSFSQEELDALKLEQEGVPEEVFNEQPVQTEQSPFAPEPVLDNTNEQAEELGDAYAVPASPAVPIEEQSGKRSKKRLIIGVVASVVAILVVGGSAAAYTLWYQNPQKILADAVMNMVKADTVSASSTSTLTLSGQAGSMSGYPEKTTVKLNGATNYTSGKVEVEIATEIGGKPETFKAGAQIDEAGTAHIRVDDLKKKFTQTVEASGGRVEDLPAPLLSIINKVDGNWLRIGTEDIAAFDEAAAKKYKEDRECINRAYATFQGSNEQQQEMIDVYLENGFLDDITSIGSKDGNLGYTVKINDKKASDFSNAAQKTTVVKALNKCRGIETQDTGSQFETGVDVQRDGPEVKTTVWVSRFGHELKQVEVEVKDDEATFETAVDLTYNQPFTISKPSNEVTLMSLQREIEELFLAQYREIQSRAESVSAQTNASYAMATVQQYMTNNRGQLPTLTQLSSTLDASYNINLSAYPTSGKASAGDDSSTIYYKVCPGSGRNFVVGYFDSARSTIVKTSDC